MDKTFQNNKYTNFIVCLKNFILGISKKHPKTDYLNLFVFSSYFL